MTDAIQVAFRRLDPEATAPSAMTEGAAGFDVAANEAVRLEPGRFRMVRTGLAIAVPSGYEAQVRPRSGLAARHGIGILNAPGTIDSDYRGEVKVILFNFGLEPVDIARGDRIAQLVVQRVAPVRWIEHASLPETERGGGGFGHTGR